MNHRIEQYLEARQVPFEVVTHGHTATSLQTARAAQVMARKLAKAVLLEGEDHFMVALLPADREVRLGQLHQDYGEHIHLADESAVRHTFSDCDPGAVPGLPMAWDLETLWDDDLLAQPDLYLEAGDHRHLIHIETRHLRELLFGMPHCHFAMPPKAH